MGNKISKDTQICTLEIESYGYESDEFNLTHFDPIRGKGLTLSDMYLYICIVNLNKDGNPITGIEELSLPQFKIINYEFAQGYDLCLTLRLTLKIQKSKLCDWSISSFIT